MCSSDLELGDEAVANKALAALAGRRIGAVGEAPIGFTPCTFDGPKLKALFGLNVDQISMEEAFTRIKRVPTEAAVRAHAAATHAQPSLSDVNEEQAVKVAGVEVALDEWRDEADLDALAIRCWPEFPTEIGRAHV